MKKWIHEIGDFKFLAAIYFMAMILFATIGNFVFFEVRSFEIITIWQIFGMACVLSILHYIQTSKMKSVLKIIIHSVLCYVTVAVFSLICGWGFMQSASVFWQFTATFIVIYAVIFTAFAFYYKNEEACLNQKLEEYKQNQ